MASSTAGKNPDSYVLDRSLNEANRLNLQHFLWKKHSGWLLHPDIPRDDPSLKVADIGTGTGIWLFDLADELPRTTTLRGYDISLSQAPNSGFWPNNVQFATFDAMGSVPDELIGQFDIVNLRFFLCVVQNNDPTPIVRNIMKLLKPGGWLQWAEADIIRFGYKHAKDGLDDRPLKELRESFESAGPQFKPGTWIPELAVYLEKEGLTNVKCWQKPASDNNPTWAAVTHYVTLAAHGSVATKLPPGSAKSGIEKTIPEATQAMDDGLIWTIHWVTHIAQKPVA